MKFYLRRKAQLVAGGSIKGKRNNDAFSGVTKMDTVRIFFFLGNFNDLDVATADVRNAYLHGFNKYNIYTMEGSEFDEYNCQVIIFVR